MHVIFHKKTVWYSTYGAWMWLNKRRIRQKILNVTRMNSFIVWEQHKYIQNNSNYKLSGLGGNMHEVGLNVVDTQTLHKCLSRNSVPVHLSHDNTQLLHHIKSQANIDGWLISQTFSTGQKSSHHILNTLMLKLNFNMPKVKKARKTKKRDRSPSPAVSERPT